MSSKHTVNILEDERSLLLCCNIYRGELVPTYSCSYFTLSEAIFERPFEVYYSATFDRYYMINSKFFYDSADGIGLTAMISLSGQKPYFFEFYDEDHKPYAIFYSATWCYQYINGTYEYPKEPKRMTCAVAHCGRVFYVPVGDNLTVSWTSPRDIFNLEENLDNCGFVKLDAKRGNITRLLEYGEKVLVVREYGFNVLSMMGSPENFKVEITAADTDKIYSNTVQWTGRKIIFCTVSGIYSFDGAEVKKLPFRYENEVQTVLHAIVHERKYYIDCTVKALNSSAIICYDPEDASCYMIPIASATAGTLCVGKDFRVYNDTGSYYVVDAKVYEIRSGEINFGSDKIKTVTEIYVDGVADIEISNGRVRRTFTGVKGRIRPRLRGKSFTFRLAASSAVSPSIRAFTATAEVCDAI